MVVYPQGYSSAEFGAIPLSSVPTGRTFNAGGCCPRACSPGMDRGVPDDVGFTRALVRYISEHMNEVDFTRVYATGMSNGGFFSHRLACEGSDFIAAQAPVAGVISNKFWDDHARNPKQWGTEEMLPSRRRRLVGVWPEIYKCEPSRPVPVMHFHGGLDPLVPARSDGLCGYFNKVEATISTWLRVNGAPDSWKNMPEIYSHLGTKCWSSGHDANNVTYCLTADLTHSWPGCAGLPFVGGPLSGSGIYATSASWDFFQRHSCPTCKP